MRLLTPLLIKLNLYYPLRRFYLSMLGRGRGPGAVFTDIYRRNKWQGSESRSGEGSSIDQTRAISAALPELLRRLGTRVMLDVPCGDFHWMSKVDLRGVQYIGGDIVAELVQKNTIAFGGFGREFREIDLCRDELPTADLIFCRDCLVHLPYRELAMAIANIRRSGAQYLLTTTFLDGRKNHDIAIGDFRPVNLQGPPFNFPQPLETVIEQCTEGGGAYADKAMALWRIQEIPAFAP